MSEGWERTARRWCLHSPGQAILLLQDWALVNSLGFHISTHPGLPGHSSVLVTEFSLVGWSGELGEKAVKARLKNQHVNCIDNRAALQSGFANTLCKHPWITMTKENCRCQGLVPREERAREEIASPGPNNPKGRVEGP